MSDIQTVLGPVPSTRLRACLPHEHVCVCGPNVASIELRANIVARQGRRLAELRRTHGCNWLIECTNTPSMGRDVESYAAVAEKARVHVIASTGFFLYPRSPWWMKTASVSDLVRHWKEEALYGMDGSNIRPGILKGASGPEINDRRRNYHREICRWFRALARAHQETGLPITTHAWAPVCKAQFDLLTAEGVPPAAIALGHADCKGSLEYLLPVVDRGGFVLLNFCGGFRAPYYRRDLKLIKALIDLGYTERLLLSVDACYYFNRRKHDVEHSTVNGKRAKWSRDYKHLFTRALPDLTDMGVTRAQLRQICEANPRKHLAGPW